MRLQGLPWNTVSEGPEIAFIPPNMCWARLRHNRTAFNKSPVVDRRLRQEQEELLHFKSCILNYKEAYRISTPTHSPL
jgi:hypothetical protein